MRFRKACLNLIIALLAANVPCVHAQNAFEQGLDAYLAGDYEKARKLWKPAAETGDPVAAFNIGVLYAQGLGVEADPAESVRWYRQAATAGYANAQFNLGSAYYNGDGAEVNIGQAIAWWEKAAVQDHPEALYNLATLYRQGDGVEQDLKRAEALYEKAESLGDTRAQHALAGIRATGPAKKNTAADPDTKQPVEKEPGTPKTETIAAEDPQHWTVQVFASVERQAAERFAREHQLAGRLRIYQAEVDGKTWFKGIYGSYAEGDAAQTARAELKRKLPGSEPWIRPFGAVQAEAIKEITGTPTVGTPSTKSPTESERNESATVLEGVASETEEPASDAEAGSRSEAAPSPTEEDSQSNAEPNDAEAAAVTRSSRQTALVKGQKAFNVQNYQKAFEEWRPLAETGMPEAQYGIGFMYESGWGAEKNYAEAFRWYQLAAQQNYVKAQFNLGMLYRNGQGVSQNDALGLYWIQTAADRGDERALNYLRTLD